jgi:hypothetical protein
VGAVPGETSLNEATTCVILNRHRANGKTQVQHLVQPLNMASYVVGVMHPWKLQELY